MCSARRECELFVGTHSHIFEQNFAANAKNSNTAQNNTEHCKVLCLALCCARPARLHAGRSSSAACIVCVCVASNERKDERLCKDHAADLVLAHWRTHTREVLERSKVARIHATRRERQQRNLSAKIILINKNAK